MPSRFFRMRASAVNAYRAADGRRFNRTGRVRNLKKRYKKGLHPLPAASPDRPPTTCRAPAPVKQEVGGSCGSSASWTVRRPRNGAAGSSSEFCPGAVVTKLAEVYERVEMARIGAGNLEMEMEMEAQRAMLDCWTPYVKAGEAVEDGELNNA